jgi:hypothetical protein
MHRPFSAYIGDEPYVFVSYAHKDSSVVYPELVWLKDSGFRIWYDEGIEAGTEWTEALATAIRQAKLCLYFVTKNSVQSQNCRNEVNFAVQHELPLLVVYLEETELPDGLSLTLSSTQAILKHELRPHEYEQKLRSRMMDLLDQEVPQPTTVIRERSSRASIGFTIAFTVVVLVGVAFFYRNVNQDETMSVNYDNEPVRELIHEIADVSNRNLIASDAIDGNVTIVLKDVSWREALDAVAVSRGYHVRLTENSIYISPDPADFDKFLPGHASESSEEQ